MSEAEEERWSPLSGFAVNLSQAVPPQGRRGMLQSPRTRRSSARMLEDGAFERGVADGYWGISADLGERSLTDEAPVTLGIRQDRLAFLAARLHGSIVSGVDQVESVDYDLQELRQRLEITEGEIEEIEQLDLALQKEWARRRRTATAASRRRGGASGGVARSASNRRHGQAAAPRHVPRCSVCGVRPSSSRDTSRCPSRTMYALGLTGEKEESRRDGRLPASGSSSGAPSPWSSRSASSRSP